MILNFIFVFALLSVGYILIIQSRIENSVYNIKCYETYVKTINNIDIPYTHDVYTEIMTEDIKFTYVHKQLSNNTVTDLAKHFNTSNDCYFVAQFDISLNQIKFVNSQRPDFILINKLNCYETLTKIVQYESNDYLYDIYTNITIEKIKFEHIYTKVIYDKYLSLKQYNEVPFRCFLLEHEDAAPQILLNKPITCSNKGCFADKMLLTLMSVFIGSMFMFMMYHNLTF